LEGETVKSLIRTLSLDDRRPKHHLLVTTRTATASTATWFRVSGRPG